MEVFPGKNKFFVPKLMIRKASNLLCFKEERTKVSTTEIHLVFSVFTFLKTSITLNLAFYIYQKNWQGKNTQKAKTNKKRRNKKLNKPETTQPDHTSTED